MRRALRARGKWFSLLLLFVTLSVIAGACAPAAAPGEPREVEVTRVVEVEKEVEKVVEKEVVITPTAVPTGPEPVTLHLNLGAEPPTADPSLATDTTSVEVTEQLFLGLTDFDDETSEIVPELATEWTPNEDLTVWTFTMRDDTVWVQYNVGTGEIEVLTDEDGNPLPVTAHDVVFGVKRTCDPRTGSSYAYVNYIIAGCQEVNESEEEITDEALDGVGLRAVDDFTVEFTLDNGASYFPAIAGMWVNRPQHAPIIEDKGERWVEPGFIVTNGPYVMTEWTHNSHMTMIRNPNWWGWDSPDAGNVERLDYVIVVESSTEFAMYENNELDVSSPPLEEMDRVRADPQLSEQLRIEPVLCTYYYGFRVDKDPVDDPLVRKALGAAINRQVLVEQVLKGGQQPANTFAPEGIFGNVASDPDIAPWYLDPEQGKQRAAEWINEAGFPDGQGLEITLMHNTSEGHKTIAEAIQAMWSEVFPAMTVSVENQEWLVYLDTVNPNKTDVAQAPHVYRLGWCADYPHQNNWVHEVLNSDAGANRPNLSAEDPAVGEQVAEFNSLTQEAQAIADTEQQKQIYRQAEKLYHEEIVGITPIYYYTTVVLTKPWIEGVFSPLGLDHYYKWNVDAEAKRSARG